MVSRVIGLLLGSTVNCIEAAMAVTGTGAIKKAVSITSTNFIKNGRGENARTGDCADRHEVTPANRQTDRLPDKETIFAVAICDIAFTPDAC